MDGKDNTNWLQLATDAYKDSTTFLEQHHYNQWQDNIRMFQNRHVRGSKYNNKLYDKRSKIFRPKTRSAAMKFEAALSTAYFSTADLVDITADDVNIETQYTAAALGKDCLQFYLQKKIPWFQILIAAGQEAWKMGQCVSYQGWEYEEDDRGNTTKDQPYIRLIPINNFRLAPTASAFDPIGTSPYLIEMIPMYIDEILDRMKQKEVLAGEPVWKSYTKEELMGYLKRLQSPVEKERQGKSQKDARDETPKVNEFDIIWVHRNIIKQDGIDYLYYTFSDMAMLSDPVPLRDVDRIGRSYVMGNLLLEAFRLYKMGMPELGQGIQEEVNNLANDRIDNIHYILHKRWIGKRGRNTDYSSLLRNVPGGVTLTDNPDEDLVPVQVGDVTSSAYAEQDRLNVDYDELVGNFSAGSVQSNRSLNETVGGLNLVSSGAGQITEYHIRNFNETWVEPVLRQLLALIAEYESDEHILSFVHPDQQEALYTLYDLQEGLRVIFNQSMTLNVNVGVSSTNPQFKAEKFMFAMNAVGQVMNSAAMSIIELKEVVKEIFGILGYKNGMRFFTIMKDQDPRITALQEQIGQLQQIIETKQIEQAAKERVEMAKISVEEKRVALEEIKIKAEALKDETMAGENEANAKKLIAEADEIIAGRKTELEQAKVDLLKSKLEVDKIKAQMSDRTKRDEIMANWQKQRETDEAKLKITLANQAMNMANAKMGTTDNDEDDVEPRLFGGPIMAAMTGAGVKRFGSMRSRSRRNQYLTGEAGPEIAVSNDALQTGNVAGAMTGGMRPKPADEGGAMANLFQQLRDKQAAQMQQQQETDSIIQQIQQAMMAMGTAFMPRAEGGPIEPGMMASHEDTGDMSAKEILKGKTNIEVVGENGPEIVETQKDGQIISNPDVQQLAQQLKAEAGVKDLANQLKAEAEGKIIEPEKTKKRVFYNEELKNPHKDALEAGYSPEMFSVQIGKGSAVKNNNPLNLRPLGARKGMRKFPTPEEGFVAGLDDIIIKQKNAPRQTIGKMIEKYAPKGENPNLEAYKKFVVERLGVTYRTPIGKIDPLALAQAIAAFESNTTVSRR